METVRASCGDFARPRVAAKKKGMGERVLRNAIRRGELQLYRPPGSWPLVSLTECDAWIRAHRVTPPPGAREHAQAVVERVLARERATEP